MRGAPERLLTQREISAGLGAAVRFVLKLLLLPFMLACLLVMFFVVGGIVAMAWMIEGPFERGGFWRETRECFVEIIPQLLPWKEFR